MKKPECRRAAGRDTFNIISRVFILSYTELMHINAEGNTFFFQNSWLLSCFFVVFTSGEHKTHLTQTKTKEWNNSWRLLSIFLSGMVKVLFFSFSYLRFFGSWRTKNYDSVFFCSVYCSYVACNATFWHYLVQSSPIRSKLCFIFRLGF